MPIGARLTAPCAKGGCRKGSSAWAGLAVAVLLVLYSYAVIWAVCLDTQTPRYQIR